MCVGLASLVWSGCGGDAPQGPPSLDGAALVLADFDSLRIQLTDGSGEARDSDGVLLSRAALTEWRVVRDLDDDGQLDALVVAWSSGGGSGTFMELAHLVLDEGDVPHWIWRGSIALGDRVRIRAMTESSGRVELHVTRHGPDDPMCCPTVDASLGFEVVGGRLTER